MNENALQQAQCKLKEILSTIMTGNFSIDLDLLELAQKHVETNLAQGAWTKLFKWPVQFSSPFQLNVKEMHENKMCKQHVEGTLSVVHNTMTVRSV